MKALVCMEFGPPETLKWVEVPRQPLGPRDVRVEVRAAGVNYADSLKLEGKYQVKAQLPWIPGVEVGGVVTEVGDRVSSCAVGQPVMGVAGERGGGFAESIILRDERVLRLPPGVSTETAATLPVVYGTALYALKQRARVQPGETLLVLGAAGGVGLAAVAIAKAMGVHVIAAASTSAKRELAIAHGADQSIDYTQANWHEKARSHCGSGRVDLVFDAVGGAAFEEAERCIGWGGRYLLIGFASGTIPSVALNRPLVKGYDLLGIRYDVWRDRHWDEARINLTQVIDWCSQGLLRPVISKRYPLSNASNAIRDLAARQATGKVILVKEDSPVIQKGDTK